MLRGIARIVLKFIIFFDAIVILDALKPSHYKLIIDFISTTLFNDNEHENHLNMS